MIRNIPKSRLLLYTILLGTLPIIFAFMHFYSEKGDLDLIEDRIESLKSKVLINENKQAINRAVVHHFKDADHFYIDKNLETMSFLEPEVESLTKLVNNPNFAGDEAIVKRLDFLRGKQNRLLFSDSSVVNYPYFQESIATLVRPVEVNNFDVQNILANVEGRDIGLYSTPENRPQLIILDFSLEKKQITETNEVYELNMKLLKREFE